MYEEDLAHIHDDGFGMIAEAASEQLLELLPADGVDVFELGPGGGLTAARLCAAGHRVVGIDGSPSMIEIARRRAPEAHFVVGSFLDVDIPRCDAICAIGEVLGYDVDGRNDEARLEATLRRLTSALRAGGLLMFDLATPGRVPGGLARRHDLDEDWAVMIETEERGSRVTRRITSFRAIGDAYRRSDETHQLTLHRPDRVLALLRAQGLSARLLRGYGAIRLPGHRVFVARKPRAPRRNAG